MYNVYVDELYQVVVANNLKPKVRKWINFNNVNNIANIKDIELFEFNSNNAEILVNENLSLSLSLSVPVTNELHIQNEENNLQYVGRKRHIKSNPSSWNRNKAKSKRVRGEAYLGYRRKDKKSTLDILYSIYDIHRDERKIGSPCLSTICKKWKTRHCLEIKYNDRIMIFNSFWKELTSRGK